jgi:acetyl esterase/lipase
MSLFATACKKDSGTSTGTQTDTSKSVTQLNVAYGDHPSQRMDVYLPAGRSATATKAIVLLHGGSWNSGSKSEFNQYIDTFRKRLPDYAIFNLDYRLVTTNTLFPAPENDVNAAVQFIADHAKEYGFNKEKISLLGFSAGAHLALLQGYKYTEPVRVKAVVDFFGPTELSEMYNKPWHPMVTTLLQSVTGSTLAANPEIYEQSSPAHFVNAQSPATLILHGSEDFIVSISQSELLKQKLANAGVRHEMVVYPDKGHGWSGVTLTDSFDRVEKFLKDNM